MQSPSQLISKLLSQGSSTQALLAYIQSRREGIITQHGAIPALLKACASLPNPNMGKSLHAEAIKSGVSHHVKIGTTLISFYSKCDFVGARKLFDEMPERNVVTWNAMIAGYSKMGDMGSALELFERMPERTSVTWIEMIDGFARGGSVAVARRVFDEVPVGMRNVVTWTVTVDGYVRNGEMGAARELFEEMPERNFFVWSSMIAGYCKMGEVGEAREIFDRIPERNLVNWNALIAGYAQNGFCEEAISAFQKMQADGFEPNEITVASALSSCAQLGLLDFGKRIHDLVNRKRIKLNQFVLNGLVDMYAKCGDISNAKMIFEGMARKNDVCWNSMISGLAAHGQSKEALELFGKMEASNEKPNELTFLSVLSACAHGGYVNEGLEIFSSMKEKYGLVAGVVHYGCLVDLLGRAGRLRDAYNLIKSMPMKPNDVVWGAMLGACRVHLDTEMAEQVVRDVGTLGANMGSGDDAHYSLMSNVYAASDEWEKAKKLRMLITKNGIQKTPGRSAFIPVS
ncbi:hypothetical protein Syun_014477 [Stephania yunnanensis]|uniref:Pentatricopeptide repeat-containing protein n=1 Tax=Stephania yunnanensis TaxID=152371 RepID=A0AAP0JIL1_9MAGN